MASTVYKVKALVLLPLVPNFLRTDSGTVPLYALNDDDLRAIAKDWGEELVRKAAKQRSESAG